MIQIGNQSLRNPMALAPMAGLTDVPFRTQAWRMGAGYMVSEMVSSKAQLWDTGKSRLRRVPVAGANPEAVQIAGTDPEVMAESARRHADDGVQVIDINFGCPAKKVCRKAAGSALLADLPLLAKIVTSVAQAVDIAVTVKTRTGLVPGDGLGVEAGRIAADCGAQMIVMHGRSRACRFIGEVDYRPIVKLKSVVAVPVLINGDISSAQQAQQMMTLSGADGVMVGRGAIGQPWIFAELTGGTLPSVEQKWQLVLEHIAHMHDFYGEQTGVQIARKHIQAYLAYFAMNPPDKSLLSLASARQQLQCLQDLRDAYLHARVNSTLARKMGTAA